MRLYSKTNRVRGPLRITTEKGKEKKKSKQKKETNKLAKYQKKRETERQRTK